MDIVFVILLDSNITTLSLQKRKTNEGGFMLETETERDCGNKNYAAYLGADILGYSVCGRWDKRLFSN
jgi:hypothetical protein